jgi:Helicase conserved C-terminal domain
MISSNVLARGIDIPDVDVVIQLGQPATIVRNTHATHTQHKHTQHARNTRNTTTSFLSLSDVVVKLGQPVSLVFAILSLYLSRSIEHYSTHATHTQHTHATHRLTSTIYPYSSA